MNWPPGKQVQRIVAPTIGAWSTSTTCPDTVSRLSEVVAVAAGREGAPVGADPHRLAMVWFVSSKSPSPRKKDRFLQAESGLPVLIASRTSVDCARLCSTCCVFELLTRATTTLPINPRAAANRPITVGFSHLDCFLRYCTISLSESLSRFVTAFKATFRPSLVCR
jgi:hypothetical protein